MAIIVFQHDSSVGVGRLGIALRDHGFKLDVRRFDLLGKPGAGAPGVRTDMPTNYDNIEGVIALGGEQNVDDSPRVGWMDSEIAYLKGAHERQLPVVGVCLGSQMLAHTLGGKVGLGTAEWGFATVNLSPAGQTEAMLAGVPWSCPQFSAHNQEVKELPPGATLLGGSSDCKIQAWKAGLRTYGFQYHFECDRAAMTNICCGADDKVDRGEMDAQIGRHYDMFTRAAERLCNNLTILLFPLQRRMTA
ncbi:MAG: type 1 glutamine amidotransferase [Phycisphaerales bacterium]|nr:type 1 glutamine amidotransferase [Phycisphaerales bacterium]